MRSLHVLECLDRRTADSGFLPELRLTGLAQVVQGLRRIDHGEIAGAGLVCNADGVFIAGRMVVERAGKPENHHANPAQIWRGLTGLVKLEAPMELRPLTLDIFQNRSHGSGQDFRPPVLAVAHDQDFDPRPPNNLLLRDFWSYRWVRLGLNVPLEPPLRL